MFNGQGFPDSFNQPPPRDPAADGDDGTALVVGTGLIDLNFKSAVEWSPQRGTCAGEGVIEFCPWQVRQDSPSQLVFEATQSLGPHKVQVHLTISLAGCTITSHTELTNLATDEPLPVSWFPHLFFPYPMGQQLF